MALAVQAEMRRNGISYSMPNYKQHKVNLNNEQYNGMLNAINAPMVERKNPKSGNPMNIIQDLFLVIKSEKYTNIDPNHAKFEKTYLFNRKGQFEKRKDIRRLAGQSFSMQIGILAHFKPEFEEKAKSKDAIIENLPNGLRQRCRGSVVYTVQSSR